MEPAVGARDVWHRYRDREALSGIDLAVERGEIFGLLGPNGGGKSTLLSLITTSQAVQRGAVRVLGLDVSTDFLGVRRRLGVVFQHPALDKKLSVEENLRCHARLYGMTQGEYRARRGPWIERFGLAGRERDRVETLSGGLARRVELAKALLHDPELLVMDEPSSGLDPGARADLWRRLGELRRQGVTVLVSTHLLDEAEQCDRIAILDRGRIVALGAPADLRAEIGGDVVTIESAAPDDLAEALRSRLGRPATVLGSAVRIEHPDGLSLIRDAANSLKEGVTALHVARPTLEDVFLKRTGHSFWEGERER